MKTTAKRLFAISKTILILIALLSVFKTGVFASWVYDSFETEESLSSWSVSDGGSVEISTERYKIDQSSLKWSYKKGGTLKLSGCNELANIKSFRMGNGIKLWIYSTNKTDAVMTIKIGNSSTVEKRYSYKIDVNMNFEGWRCIWARVNEFAGTAYSNANADTLLITLPEAMGEGVMYLDAFEVTDYVHYAACSDFQITNMPVTNTTYQYAAYSKIPESTGETQCTQEHRDAFETIKNRLDDYIIDYDINYAGLDKNDPVKIRYDQTMSRALGYIKIHNRQAITRRADGSIDAAGITSNNDTLGTKISSYEKIWVSLALDWKINKNEQSKEKLFELFDYCYEQGWAEGSSMGAMRFDEIRADGYAFAVYMMKDELKETGRWERELANLKWRSEFGYVFAYDDPEIAAVSSVDADKMRSTVLFQLMYILLMEDSPEKVGYMKAYTKYFNDIVMPRPGSDGGIKKDYTIWHHTSPYMSGYGSEAISILCQIKYLLSGTCFDASGEATDTLKKSLDVYRVSADKYDVPMRLRGRFPESDNVMVSVMTAYAFLAASGDKTSAEIFLDLWDETDADVIADVKANPMPAITYLTTVGQMSLFEKVKEKAAKDGYSAADVPEGVHIFPYGGYAVSRIGDTMAAVGGWSKYIWDYEGSTTENLYGRYTNYGSLTLTGKDGFYGGGIITNQGWDWARWPGTTSKHLSNAELEVKGNARNLSDETFLGGVAKGNSGVYAMKLHDLAYDNSFYANKSYFFFDDKIICIGSDIKNTDSLHNTETTLFQNVMPDSTAVTVVNGEAVSGLGYKKDTWNNKGVYLTDAVGNAYVIPDSSGLTVERRENKSLAFKGAESTGQLAMAYINHGTAPSGAGYEYVVLPEGDDKKAQNVLNNPGYEVIKKDSAAHIVKDTNSGEIGYAIFKSSDNLTAGVVKSADAPCIIMEKATVNGVGISFCDPDLRIVTGGKIKDMLTESSEKATKVVISGRWDILRGNDKAKVLYSDENSTTLEFVCSDGKQLDVELKRIYPDGSIELCNDSEIYINEEFSTGKPPQRNRNGVWTFSGSSRLFTDGVFTSVSRGVGRIKLDTAVTRSGMGDSKDKYVLTFDMTRSGDAAGGSQFFQLARNGVSYKDVRTGLSEDGKTYYVDMIYNTNEGPRTLVSDIPVGEFITIEIVYNMGGEYITMDIAAKNSDGQLIGNQYKNYKLCNQELSTKDGFDEFVFVNYITGENIKYDNIRFYRYKKANEFGVYDISFKTFDSEDVDFDTVKKGEEVSVSAKFNIAENENSTAFFAVYDDKDNLVNVVLKELTAEGEKSFSKKLFTAEADGSYNVKLFLWRDSKNMVPIDTAAELR